MSETVECEKVRVLFRAAKLRSRLSEILAGISQRQLWIRADIRERAKMSEEEFEEGGYLDRLHENEAALEDLHRQKRVIQFKLRSL